MKEPTLEDLKKELAAANKRIEIMDRQAEEEYKVRCIIVAAGLLSLEKFDEARTLLND